MPDSGLPQVWVETFASLLRDLRRSFSRDMTQNRSQTPVSAMIGCGTHRTMFRCPTNGFTFGCTKLHEEKSKFQAPR